MRLVPLLSRSPCRRNIVLLRMRTSRGRCMLNECMAPCVLQVPPIVASPIQSRIIFCIACALNLEPRHDDVKGGVAPHIP